MKTDIKKLASFFACAIWADEKFDETQREVVDDIAEALEIDPKDLSVALYAAIADVNSMDEEQLNQYLIEAAVDIDEDEALIIFECAIDLVLADKVLMKVEVNNLLTMAEVLGIETEDAVLMLVDMVKENPHIKIDMQNDVDSEEPAKSEENE